MTSGDGGIAEGAAKCCCSACTGCHQRPQGRKLTFSHNLGGLVWDEDNSICDQEGAAFLVQKDNLHIRSNPSSCTTCMTMVLRCWECWECMKVQGCVRGQLLQMCVLRTCESTAEDVCRQDN